MIKRILVAIDTSSSAVSALSVAASLCGIMKAELIGLFVEDTARFVSSSGKEAAATEAEVEGESMKLYAQFQQSCEKAQIEGRFLSIRGTPKDVIRERAKTVDFVIIGNLGDPKVANREPGLTVQGLLASVARPVLVVPADVAGEPMIVVAYDGSLSSDRLLCAAVELAEISDMNSLHLVTVASSTEDCQAIQAPAIDYVSAYPIHVTPVCLTGKPEEALLAYVQQVDASILAIAAFGPNRVKESVFGSTTERVLLQSDFAVLLVS